MAAARRLHSIVCSLMVSFALCAGACASRNSNDNRSLSAELARALDPKDLDVEFVINDRPVAYRASDRLSMYEPTFLSAISAARHLQDRRALPNALDAAGVLYYRNGMYSRSLAMFLQAIPLKEGVFGKVEIADGLDEAANAARGATAYDVAERLYRQALSLRREVYGPLSPQVATSYMNLSYLYSDMSQPDRAAFVESFARKIICDNKLAGNRISSLEYEPVDLMCSTRDSLWSDIESKISAMAAGPVYLRRNELARRYEGPLKLSGVPVSHAVVPVGSGMKRRGK